MDNECVTLVSVDPVIGARARDLRREIPRLKTPDAIQIATALVSGASTLYTYDERDLLRLDADPAIGGLRITEPPVEHQLPLVFEEPRMAATAAFEGDQLQTNREETGSA